MTASTEIQPAAISSRHLTVSLLLVILALAAFLRFWHLGDQNFWLDEFFSLELSASRGYLDAQLPQDRLLDPPPRLTTLQNAPRWTAIIPNMRQDTHPPLYFVLLRLWRDAFGSDETAIRSFSVLWSLAAIVFLYIAVASEPRLGPTIALWAAAILAVAVPQLAYAREARNNEMGLALVLAAAALLVRIQHRGATAARLAALMAATLAAMFTNYYCVSAMLACGLYTIIGLRGHTRRRALACFAIAAVIYAIAWGPSLLAQRPAFALWQAPQPQQRPHLLAHTLQRAGIAPLRQLIAAYSASNALASVVAIVLLIIFLLTWRRRELWLWWLWLIVGIALPAGHDLLMCANHLVLPKYTLAAAPAVAIVLAISGQWFLPRPLRYAPAILGIALCVPFLPQAFNTYDCDWRGAAAFVDQHSGGGSVTLYRSELAENRGAGWAFLSLSSYQSNPGAVVLYQQPLPAALLARLRQAPRVVLVLDRDDASPAGELPGWKIDQGRRFHNTASVWVLTPR